MGEFRDMTLGHSKEILNFRLDPRKGIGVAATFDTTTTTAATRDTNTEWLNERYNIIRHWDTFTDGSVYTFKLDHRYSDGDDITVDVEWTTDTSTSGNAYLKAGLTQPTATGVLGTDTDSEYIAFNTYAGPTAAGEVITTSFTFSGSGITANDQLAFIFINDAASGSSTINDELKVLGINIKLPINKL